MKQYLRLDYANRHGLIAGATGTGKTRDPADPRRGLFGAGRPGGAVGRQGRPFGPRRVGLGGFQASRRLHDTRGHHRPFPTTATMPSRCSSGTSSERRGHPVRTTGRRDGTPCSSHASSNCPRRRRAFLNIAFRVADEQGLPLLDLKDLQSLLVWVGENRADLSLRYGNVATASIGAIQRRLLVLETQGAASFFGEPALELSDLMRTDLSGRGMISILAADRLMSAPRLYAPTLLWLLSGNSSRRFPRSATPTSRSSSSSFDEAHLLFDDAPKALVDKVETGRAAESARRASGSISSRKTPPTCPRTFSASSATGCSIALRAFTAKDRKNLRLAAQTYPRQPGLLHRGGDPRGRHRRGGHLECSRRRARRAWSSAR